jgi:hypothetical protein
MARVGVRCKARLGREAVFRRICSGSSKVITPLGSTRPCRAPHTQNSSFEEAGGRHPGLFQHGGIHFNVS